MQGSATLPAALLSPNGVQWTPQGPSQSSGKIFKSVVRQLNCSRARFSIYNISGTPNRVTEIAIAQLQMWMVHSPP